MTLINKGYRIDIVGINFRSALKIYEPIYSVLVENLVHNKIKIESLKYVLKHLYTCLHRNEIDLISYLFTETL